MSGSRPHSGLPKTGSVASRLLYSHCMRHYLGTRRHRCICSDLCILWSIGSEYCTLVPTLPAMSSRFQETHRHSIDSSTIEGNLTVQYFRAANANSRPLLTRLRSRTQGCLLPSMGSPNLASQS